MVNKGSLYRSIISNNARYKISKNPLFVLLNEQTSLFKSAEDQQQQREIETIIEHELEKDFKIGGHVDFDYLIENIKEENDFYCGLNQKSDVKMCSLFVDLRNFTRRALFVDEPGIETIQEIAQLKQKAISTWIKLARYYQAHIHSITGDGLMILVGGTQPEDADDWTLGARAFLIALRVIESTDILNEELKQILVDKGQESFASNPNNLIDIKVGVEYSGNTLINPQGVIVNESGDKRAVGEVKATSFEIDFSAKLLGYYNGIKEEKIEGSPKYGRVLIIGEKFKELLDFKEEVIIRFYTDYERQMFNQKQIRKVYYLDCKPYKDKIITIEDVAAYCNVYDASEMAKAASIHIARQEKVQHG